MDDSMHCEYQFLLGFDHYLNLRVGSSHTPGHVAVVLGFFPVE
jgi:hypothetical protein